MLGEKDRQFSFFSQFGKFPENIFSGTSLHSFFLFFMMGPSLGRVPKQIVKIDEGLGKMKRVRKIATIAGLVVFAFLLSLLFVNPAQQIHFRAQENQDCLECHGDPEFTGENAQGQEVSLYVNVDSLKNSVHAGLSCTDCHSDVTKVPHETVPKKVNCGQCHGDIYKSYIEGSHGRAYLTGDKEAPTCATCHGTHNIHPSNSTLSPVSKINQPKTCGQCHGKAEFQRKHNIPLQKPVHDYLASIHYKKIKEGGDAAACGDCHDPHAVLNGGNTASKINRKNLPETCGQCHFNEYKQFIDSVHGEALLQGVDDAPNCTDCHGQHKILSTQNQKSPVNRLNVSLQTCARCHSNEVLNEKYDMPSDRVLTYENSYHGLAIQGKSKIAANCTSCHGVHNIYPSWDSRSTVNVNNLDRTCGQCHPGASKKFASIPVHQPRSKAVAVASDIITKIYILLIISVIGSMFLHNFLIWLQAVLRKYRRVVQEPSITRFNKNMVVQHLLLFLSFTTLVITGFALKFPDAFWVKFLSSIGLHEGLRHIIHRVAGTTLILTSFYHLFWLFFSKRGRLELRYMVPVLKDVQDAVYSVEYYLGLRATMPEYDKYDYTEKAEYWALIWGTTVMGASGLILWFPVISANLFGGWIVPIALLFHYFEAILATLAILVWHFFFVIFHPSEYPMSLVSITGKMPCEECKKHHGFWYRKLMHEEPPEVRKFFDEKGECEELEED